MKIRNPSYRFDLPRKVINQRIGRIKRMFRWATENELVPPSLYHGLVAVRGLQKGRAGARETQPVKPAPVESVKKVLAHLLPPVAAMVQGAIAVQQSIGALDPPPMSIPPQPPCVISARFDSVLAGRDDRRAAGLPKFITQYVRVVCLAAPRPARRPAPGSTVSAH